MIARLDRVRTALVVAPHPDDEAIGAYALMDRLRRQGARLWVLVVSDGAASHPGSRRWPQARLARERRRETLRAMATLAVPPNRVIFLDLADGELTELSETVSRACGKALRRMPPPDLIVGPVADDDHADHRAVARVLDRRRLAPLRLGYQVWPLGADRRERLVITLDAAQRTAKRRTVISYRTQSRGAADAVTGMRMRAHHLRAFAGPAERFRLL